MGAGKSSSKEIYWNKTPRNRPCLLTVTTIRSKRLKVMFFHSLGDRLVDRIPPR